jgi:hypothetical protein
MERENSPSAVAMAMLAASPPSASWLSSSLAVSAAGSSSPSLAAGFAPGFCATSPPPPPPPPAPSSATTAATGTLLVAPPAAVGTTEPMSHVMSTSIGSWTLRLASGGVVGGLVLKESTNCNNHDKGAKPSDNRATVQQGCGGQWRTLSAFILNPRVLLVVCVFLFVRTRALSPACTAFAAHTAAINSHRGDQVQSQDLLTRALAGSLTSCAFLPALPVPLPLSGLPCTSVRSSIRAVRCFSKAGSAPGSNAPR